MQVSQAAEKGKQNPKLDDKAKIRSGQKLLTQWECLMVAISSRHNEKV